MDCLSVDLVSAVAWFVMLFAVMCLSAGTAAMCILLVFDKESRFMAKEFIVALTLYLRASIRGS